MKARTRNYKILIFSFLSFFCLSSVSAVDYPNTSIAIINIDLILNESKAAIDANDQIQIISDEIQEELKKDEEALLNDQKKLIEGQQIMAPEAFEVKRVEYEKKVQNFQVKSQETFTKLDKMIAIARGKILDGIKPILEEVAEEKGITVMLEKNVVILNADSMDITKFVLKKLNKNLPELKVEFEE